ncbi:putative cartilage matrix-associated protein precursor [Silurus meridionalis]|nr:putative cartilage matrix-associated protein precursor [Silurus meridionalis]
MSWMRPASLACLALLFILTLFFEVDGASVTDGISNKRSEGLPEQDERTHESTEQWREFHHDGLDPSYEYNRHTV